MDGASELAQHRTDRTCFDVETASVQREGLIVDKAYEKAKEIGPERKDKAGGLSTTQAVKSVLDVENGAQTPSDVLESKRSVVCNIESDNDCHSDLPSHCTSETLVFSCSEESERCDSAECIEQIDAPDFGLDVLKCFLWGNPTHKQLDISLYNTLDEDELPVIIVKKAPAKTASPSTAAAQPDPQSSPKLPLAPTSASPVISAPTASRPAPATPTRSPPTAEPVAHPPPPEIRLAVRDDEKCRDASRLSLAATRAHNAPRHRVAPRRAPKAPRQFSAV